jgi:hypothetical protein
MPSNFPRVNANIFEHLWWDVTSKLIFNVHFEGEKVAGMDESEKCFGTFLNVGVCGWIVDHPSFGCNMYTPNTGHGSLITPTQEPTAIKLAKETKVVGRTHDVKI